MESMDLTAYICKDWSPVGIEIFSAKRRLEQKDGEITAYLCPDGFGCEGIDVAAYITQEGKESACLLCPEQSVFLSAEAFFVQTLNTVRQTRPEKLQNPREIKLDELLSSVASWFAKDMAENGYFSEDGVDRFGKTFADRIYDAGGDYIVAGELRFFKQFGTDEVITDEKIVLEAVGVWANSKGSEDVVFTAEFNLAGVGIAKKRKDDVVEVYVVLDLVYREEPKIDVEPPDLPCSIDCVQTIKWWQSYIKEEYTTESGTRATRKIPGDILRFQAKLPPLCTLERAELVFEVSPCKWVLTPANLHEGIPADGSLQLTWTGKPAGAHNTRISEDGILTAEFLISETCFVPGEWVALLVWLKGYDACSPIVFAKGWFETKCLTSGKIQGCGLVENDTVISGGYLHEMDLDWIGDQRLRWFVLYKGNFFWIKSSDWHRYELGDRCFIFKNGVSVFADGTGGMSSSRGCRWPVSEALSKDDAILSYSNVSYELDASRDIIVPFAFF